ncbi:multidrug effflux MFS transporter [Planctomonas sp. JC2975]|uniref:multidrug effflux MFS transporter n=1 Tax=Planctomonas sp. JC2975 TaxID=2729626 RepID=UPI001F0E4052|nr:multidrug effflux MFS transporter [Planctomonas sp. JC2975]
MSTATQPIPVTEVSPAPDLRQPDARRTDVRASDLHEPAQRAARRGSAAPRPVDDDLDVARTAGIPVIGVTAGMPTGGIPTIERPARRNGRSPVTLPSSVVHPGDALPTRKRVSYILILGALTALGPFTMDTYLPSMPRLETDFNVSTAIIQLTLTATTVGFGLGQLIVGPWSDKVGRRTPLILATAVHILASLGVAMAPNVELLSLFRLLQGLGAAASGVVAMAMVRDLFSGHRLVTMLSRLALVNGLAPVIAPVLGSQLLLIMPWRGIFWVIAAYSAVMLVCLTLWIVETRPKEARLASGHSSVGQRFKSVLSDRVFVGIVIVSAMNFSGLFSYLSSSSFVFQKVYHFDAQQYGALFAVNSVGIIIGVQSAARLAKRVGPQWVLAVSTATMTIAAALIVILGSTGTFGIWGVIVPLWFFIASCGFGFPCVQVLALNGHGAEAGTAASLQGASNFAIAGLISPLVGLLGVASAAPMGIVMLGCSNVSVCALWFVVRPRTVPALAR